MLRAAWRLGLYLFFTLLCMPVQLVLFFIWPRGTRLFPVWYHRQCLKLFGITVEVVGQPAAHHPCLYVSNHSSYLDIPVLGSLVPACFVAKREVAGWPLFGLLAKLQNTLFIDRRVSKVGQGQAALLARLKAGDDLVLFPEGTSSDGLRVLPFRRALFQAVLDQAGELPLVIQPVSVFCSEVNGTVADRHAKQLYAWFGDMELLPHLWQFCQLRSVKVRVIFGRPLSPGGFHSRHDLTRMAQAAVADGQPIGELIQFKLLKG